MSASEAFVLDHGSHTTKCGFASQVLARAPSVPVRLPSVVGTPRYPSTFPTVQARSSRADGPAAVGYEVFASSFVEYARTGRGAGARATRGLHRLVYPIRYGTVLDAASYRLLLRQAVAVSAGPAGAHGAAHAGEAGEEDSGEEVRSPLDAAAIAQRLETHLGQRTASDEQRHRTASDDHAREGLFAPLLRERPSLHRSAGDAYEDSGHGVIFSLIESPFASRKQRLSVVEEVLESTYGGSDSAAHAGSRNPVRGVFCGIAPLLSLYSTGQTTGLVLDVGDGTASTAAAVDGCAVTAAMQRDDGVCVGERVTDFLQRLLHTHGVAAEVAHGVASPAAAAPSAWGRETVNALKECCCAVLPGRAFATTPAAPAERAETWCSRSLAAAYVRRGDAVARVEAATARNWQCPSSSGARGDELHEDDAVDRTARAHFTLPDGSTVNLADSPAAVQAPEVLFAPAVAAYGSDRRGVVELLADTLTASCLVDSPFLSASSDGALTSSSPYLAPKLLSYVLVTGGSSLLPGFAQRVLFELQQRTPSSVRVKVVAPVEREVAAWVGAALLSQLSSFSSEMVVSREKFLEEGEPALHARLFA